MAGKPLGGPAGLLALQGELRQVGRTVDLPVPAKQTLFFGTYLPFSAYPADPPATAPIDL